MLSNNSLLVSFLLPFEICYLSIFAGVVGTSSSSSSDSPNANSDRLVQRRSILWLSKPLAMSGRTASNGRALSSSERKSRSHAAGPPRRWPPRGRLLLGETGAAGWL